MRIKNHSRYEYPRYSSAGRSQELLLDRGLQSICLGGSFYLFSVAPFRLPIPHDWWIVGAILASALGVVMVCVSVYERRSVTWPIPGVPTAPLPSRSDRSASNTAKPSQIPDWRIRNGEPPPFAGNGQSGGRCVEVVFPETGETMLMFNVTDEDLASMFVRDDANRNDLHQTSFSGQRPRRFPWCAMWATLAVLAILAALILGGLLYVVLDHDRRMDDANAQQL